jgi:hypothetical protein
MSRALGGTVTRAPVTRSAGSTSTTSDPAAADWFGGQRR